VYVAGQMSLAGPSGGHFGNDTVITNTNKTMFLAKWDTGGNFQWVHLPQPDTMSHISAWSYSRPADMDLGSDGNIYLLSCLSPGAYEGGRYLVSSFGAHVLKYNSQGQFLGGVTLPITPRPFPYPSQFIYRLCESRIRFDGANNRMIVSGPSGAMGATTIAGTTLGDGVFFVASFNAASGSLNWLKASNPIRHTPQPTSNVSSFAAPALDAKGNVYILAWGADSAYFNGVLFRNAMRNGNSFVMKMDVNTGQNIWTTQNHYSIDGTLANSSIAYTNNKLGITGFYSDSLIYPGGVVTNNPPTDTNDAFIMQLDAATGAVQKVTTLTGSADVKGWGIAADRRGNFYLSGSYNAAAQTIGTDALTIDNYHNFFVSKWGWSNCTCVPVSASLVKAASAGLMQAFTYTGTVAGLDSVVWDFGDGSRQKVSSGFGNTVLHTYAANGLYTVCVTAYNESCGGSSRACLNLPLSVGAYSGLEGVQVYPNPTTDAITIEGAAGSRLELMNMLGQPIAHYRVEQARQSYSLRSFPVGIYMLRITDAAGHSGVVRVSRQ